MTTLKHHHWTRTQNCVLYLSLGFASNSFFKLLSVLSTEKKISLASLAVKPSTRFNPEMAVGVEVPIVAVGFGVGGTTPSKTFLNGFANTTTIFLSGFIDRLSMLGVEISSAGVGTAE